MKSTSRTEISAPAAGGGGTAGAGGRTGTASESSGSERGVPADRVEAGLRSIVGLADQRDRLMGRLVRELATVHGHDRLPARLDGMSLHVWLQHHARATHTEARDLLGAVDVLAAMPATLAGLSDGWLSWSQVAAIVRAGRRVPVARRAELDELVAAAMLTHREWEPDAIVEDVWQWVDAHEPSRLEKDEAAADRGEFLTLAPRLFAGGTIYGELGSVSFATVAEALDAPLGPPVTPPDDLDDPDAVDQAYDRLDAQRRRLTKHHGRRLAGRLVELCEASLAGNAPGDGGGEDGTFGEPRPMVLATIGLDSLLDQDRTPGWLLTTLAGGRMKLSTTALQRLVDGRGADLHTTVLDDCGDVVGVGFRTQIPPGWLRQAIWARDTVVRDPDGTCPVRHADLDHRNPWPAGPTDATNLDPLSRRWHNHKTTKRWTVHRARDGTTTWHHSRHPWTIHLAPPHRDLTHPPDPPGADPPAADPPILPLNLLPDPAPT